VHKAAELGPVAADKAIGEVERMREATRCQRRADLLREVLAWAALATAVRAWEQVTAVQVLRAGPEVGAEAAVVAALRIFSRC
jgi:hypothetical protein